MYFGLILIGYISTTIGRNNGEFDNSIWYLTVFFNCTMIALSILPIMSGVILWTALNKLNYFLITKSCLNRQIVKIVILFMTITYWNTIIWSLSVIWGNPAIAFIGDACNSQYPKIMQVMSYLFILKQNAWLNWTIFYFAMTLWLSWNPK